MIFVFSNRDTYLLKRYLKECKQIIVNIKPYSEDESFIFINAWNEWAEGNHLERCQKWGKKYLEITKKIVRGK